MRAKMRTTLLKKLASAGLTEDDIDRLESGIFSASSNSTNYSNQAKIVFLHLAPDTTVVNDYLLPAVKDGRLSLEEVGGMKECDMNPDKWEGSRAQMAEAKLVSHGPQVVASDIIKCRCGGQTTFTESQTRSCDEAMTIKATCLKCGKRFNI
jgi:DNA-directed RNA polymerase subunit M/transcription elongation factor TFIIS